MATFWVLGEEVSIEIEEFLSECSPKEIDRLRKILLNGKHLSPGEVIFEDYLSVLHGKWNLLTKEEEETVINIAKRFK